MNEPFVTIKQGSLRGTTATDAAGALFFKFHGIPYAKPPLGDLRFKAPLPAEPWSGVLDATKERDICYSRDPLNNGTILGSEDCLFLNVYTKILSEHEKKLPVMVWIHGGGFTFGSGNEDLYGPEFLMTGDVLLVTINYRLGILGFISFEGPSLDISGNAGLKDQVLALKWVQSNISHFGGDPNNVTIFGESAGAASVHLLMLSPQGQGLFHKAIAHSGCALNPWVEGTRGSKLLAAAMNLEGADDKTIYHNLMTKSVQEIFELQEKIGEGKLGELRSFAFVVEKNSKEPFLDKKPIDLLHSGTFINVPFMIGVTSSEGMIFEFHRKPDEPEMVSIESTIPWFFEYEDGTPEKRAAAEKIQKFYFNGEEYSRKWLTKKYDLFSDSGFLYGIYVTTLTQFHHSTTPIYLYKVSIETELNFLKKILKIDVPGVCHCDDLGYLFKMSGTPEIQPDSKEDTFIKYFVDLWTNFAKSGNPTPTNDLLKTTWKPVTGSNLEFLDIGEELIMSSDFSKVSMEFWQKLFEESPGGKKSKCS